jgi:subtilisin family serine protease
MLRLSILASATLLALSITPTAEAGGRPDLVKKNLAEGKQYASGQMIIQFRSSASASDKARVNKTLGNGKSLEMLARRGSRQGVYGDIELVSFNFPAGTQMSAKIDAIIKDPAVDYAEPNWLVHHMATSNDPYFTDGSLWGMYGAGTSPANSFGSGAAATWATKGADCSNVVVGIIDEGYMYTHPDLAANAYTNPGEIAANGRDDDGNGLVDDVYGWDFANNDNTVFDGTGDDHGTHVGGTIGAVGGNGVGVAGVCWNVKLMSAKFLGSRGGTSANAIKAVDYFTDLKNKGMNIVATNNSWGGGGYSQGLADAIERANAAGILFIAAAGNSGADNDANPAYPSGYPSSNIIAVAALNGNGSLASYSQYGFNSVDICAPGTAVLSTIPQAIKGKVSGSYGSYSGTSMATPHVTGAAALYKARNPSATAAQIKSAIYASAVPTASCSGKVSTGARLDISKW